LAIDFDGRLWPRLGGQIGNHVSAQLAMSLPLGAYFVFYGNRLERIAAIASLALIVELVLRAASRGAFLGLIAGAVWLVLRAKGRPRIYAIVGIIAGVLAIFPALDKEDQAKVFERYFSTFANAEDRDMSAASRLNFWQAGVKMIADHPLGSGFEAAFESDLGATYVAHLDLGDGRIYRSVHNGYLDIAASWGIHGLMLFLVALGLACLRLNRSTRSAFATGNRQTGFLGCCFQAAIIVLLMSSLTGSNLKGDGYIWSISMMLAFARLAPVFTPSVFHSQSNGATVSNGTNVEYRSWESTTSSRAASC